MQKSGYLHVCLFCMFSFFALTSALGRGKKGLLRKKMRSARSWQVRTPGLLLPLLWSYPTLQEWKEAAATLDEYLHFDEWKKVDEDPFYDWKLVRKVTSQHF